MAQIRCRMCGGTLKIDEINHIAVCEYCFTKQTLPVLDNEKKERLFDRADRLLKQSEFDRAAGIYESIISQYDRDPEGYWGLVLCRYGIEYVDDPETGRKVPTCHRLSVRSVTEDPDYLRAAELSKGEARLLYISQAEELEQIRERTIAISSSVLPYDIFICYKETDEQGERTRDSLIAQEIYEKLINLGYKVFYARISLEDRIGQDYEPVIFSALNSSKIMLAVSTSYDNYDAVWVKNEWSRFLKLSESDGGKTLIPVYMDLDPSFDLPKEFQPMASQDLGRTGAMQDLIYGIQKLLPVENPGLDEAAADESEINDTIIQGLLHRAELALDDKDPDSAESFYRKVQEIDPNCPASYIGLTRTRVTAEERRELLEKLKSVAPEISSYELDMLKSKNASLILRNYVRMEDENRVRTVLEKYPDQIAHRIKKKGGADYNILSFAISNEIVSMLPVLLSLGADPNSERKAVTKDGKPYTSSCLQDAILKSNEEMVNILLEAGADAGRIEKDYTNSGYPRGRSKLYLASTKGLTFDCMRNLIRHGADPKGVGVYEETPWGVFQQSCIQSAVRKGWMDDVLFYEENGVVLNPAEEISFFHESGVSRRPLLSLVAFGSANPKMLLYLLEHGADPNTQRTDITQWGEEKISCLWDFVRKYKNECVKILLEHGANANTTAGFYYEDRKEVTSVLFEAVAGALEDDNVFKRWNVLRNTFFSNELKKSIQEFEERRNSSKNTIESFDSMEKKRPLSYAEIEENTVRSAKAELDKDIEREKAERIRDAGFTKDIDPSLHLELVKMLLEAGADVRIGSEKHYAGCHRNVSVLSYAICHCAGPEIVELLLQYGADPNEHITEYDRNGKCIGEWSPLLQAVLCNPQSPPVVALLLKYGASLKDKVTWDEVASVKVRDFPLYNRDLDDGVKKQLKESGFRNLY